MEEAGNGRGIFGGDKIILFSRQPFEPFHDFDGEGENNGIAGIGHGGFDGLKGAKGNGT